MTMRRAVMRWSPAMTVCPSTKLPNSRMTRTPSPSNRSWLSTGAMVSMVRRTWRLAAA